MSEPRDVENQAPTIVTATAVGVDKGHAGGGGQIQGGSVPVVVAQPWSIQEQYGRLHGSGGRQQHVAVQQHMSPNGSNVVTFATLNAPYGHGGIEQQFTDRQVQLIDVYRLSRFVRNVSLINIFFTIISGVFSYIYFFFLPFPICGYWGAKAFNNYFLYIYIGYLVLETIFSLVLIVIVNSVTFTILRTLYIIFNILIIRYTGRLCGFVAHMTDEDREFLATNEAIVDSERSCC